MGGFVDSAGGQGGVRLRAVEAKLAQTQEQLRATSDILKVLTSGTSAQASARDQEFVAVVAQHPIARDRATLVGRVTIDRTVQQIDDVLADPEYRRTDFQRLGG